MSTVRGLHCMTTVGDRLYVIGGNHFKGNNQCAWVGVHVNSTRIHF